MRYKSNLEKLIKEVEEYEWFFDIYVPTDTKLTSETNVLVLDDEAEDERDEFDEPIYPKSIGLSLLMSISQLQDVITNAEAVKGNVSLPQIINAIIYYYENDAFIN